MITRIHGSITYGATAGAWSRSITGIVAAGGGTLARATFSAAHGLSSGCNITVAGVTGVTDLNDTWEVLVVSSTVVDLVGTGAISGSPAGTITATLPALDISGETHPDPTVCVRIEGLAADKKAVIAVEDTVDDFTAAVQRYVVNACGELANGLTQEFKFPARQHPLHRFGVTSGKARVNVLQVDSDAGLVVSAWVEN